MPVELRCVLPVELWLVPEVEGVLQLLDEAGLAGHPEQPLLPEPLLTDETHALLYQQRRQTHAHTLLTLTLHRLLQMPTKHAYKHTQNT